MHHSINWLSMVFCNHYNIVHWNCSLKVSLLFQKQKILWRAPKGWLWRLPMKTRNSWKMMALALVQEVYLPCLLMVAPSCSNLCILLMKVLIKICCWTCHPMAHFHRQSSFTHLQVLANRQAVVAQHTRIMPDHSRIGPNSTLITRAM